MAEHEIESLVWHRADERVDVIYVEGEPDFLMGSEHVVAELARTAGLQMAPGPHPGTVRWVRDPEPGSVDAEAPRSATGDPGVDGDHSELHNKT